MSDKPDPRALTPEEESRRKQRNLVIGGLLLAWVVIIFLITVFKLGASVTERPF